MYSKRNNYAEGISMGHVFVLTDDKNVPKNLPCWCKDYFQDYFWMIKTQQDFGSIFGFSHPVEKEAKSYKYHIRMGSKNDTKGNSYNYYDMPYRARLNIAAFLKRLAADLKLSIPTVSNGKDNEGDIVISFNSDWYIYPYVHSLFTSAIRIGTYISYDTFLEKDWTNLLIMEKHRVSDLTNSVYNNIRGKLLTLIQKGLVDKPWTNYTNGNIHGSSGIQSTTL